MERSWNKANLQDLEKLKAGCEFRTYRTRTKVVAVETEEMGGVRSD